MNIGNMKHMNSIEDIEEDIKILEEFKTNGYNILLMKYGDRIKTNFKLAKAIEHILSEYKKVLKENEVLSKENKELQKEIDQMKSLDIYKLVEDWETGQFIPIQKVKDKIEELKKKVEELTDEKGYWGGSDLLEQIKVLQELLEENENHIPRIN